jgi:hypothetical protein
MSAFGGSPSLRRQKARSRSSLSPSLEAFFGGTTAFGHAAQADATKFVKSAGGQVLGSVGYPLGSADFSAYLLQAQSSGANVVAFAKKPDESKGAGDSYKLVSTIPAETAFRPLAEGACALVRT